MDGRSQKGQSKGYFGLLAHHWSHTDNVKKAYGYLDKAVNSHEEPGHTTSQLSFGRALELSENPDLDEANQADESKRAGWQRKLRILTLPWGGAKSRRSLPAKRWRPLGSRSRPMSEDGKSWGFKGALRQLFHQLMPRALVVAKDDQLRQHYAEFSYASRRLAELFYYEHADLQMMGTSLLSLNMAERVGNFPGTCFAYSMFAVVLGARAHRKAARYFGRHASSPRVSMRMMLWSLTTTIELVISSDVVNTRVSKNSLKKLSI